MWNRRKNEKKRGQFGRPLGQCEKCQHSHYRASQKEKRERDKEPEETREEEIAESFPNMGKQTVNSRKHRDPTQYKPKEKDTKTHSNQTMI